MPINDEQKKQIAVENLQKCEMVGFVSDWERHAGSDSSLNLEGVIRAHESCYPKRESVTDCNRVGWQPIDTAPKDGTRFIAGHYQVRISQPNYFQWYIAVWAKEGWIPTDDEEFGEAGNDGEYYCPSGFYREGADRYDEDHYFSVKPTHWMPVSKAPEVI